MFPKFIDNLIVNYLNSKGYVRARGPDGASHARRMCICFSNNIDLILDIGANKGQFALEMRNFGYKNQIISFEPLNDAFKELSIIFHEDEKWSGFNIGLSNKKQKKKLNISSNSVSSSFLEMEELHSKYEPNSKYIGFEEVEISTLDLEFKELYKDQRNIWLKIDVQGFELNVLEGALQTLSLCKIVQIEVSLKPLYKNEPDILNIISFMKNNNFDIIGFESGFQHPTNGSLFQVDIIFINNFL